MDQPEAVVAGGAGTDIRRSARIAGLKGFDTPTLEQVEHRRVELFLLAFAVAIGLAIALVTLSSYDAVPLRWLRVGSTGAVVRVLIVALTIAFSAYVFEKERHLRKLSRALMDEKVLSAALTNRLRDISSLTEASKAVLQVIELDDVLAVILRSASELLEADDGSVLLPVGDGFVVATATGRSSEFIGERRSTTEGLAGYVALHREPLLIDGEAGRGASSVIDWVLLPGEIDVKSAMSVPLVSKGELLGVLNLNVTSGERRYSEYDLRALALFGEHAAIAIRHARLLRKERLLREQLAEQDRIRTQLVSTMTHDLKSPVTTIMGSVQILLEAADQLPYDRRVERLEAIELGSKRLLRLIEQILDAARSQSRPPLLQSSLNLVDHVKPLATSFASAHNRAVDVRTAERSISVDTDPEALDQVMSIFLENACVHTPEGTSVWVELDGSGGAAEIKVCDDGPGIPPDDLPDLFVPFRRGVSTTGQPGAGLGMFIASNLVQAMGGEISVQSLPGKGTTVRFTLPRTSTEEKVSALGT
jgi:two-component system sensor histidine kinase KdpD